MSTRDAAEQSRRLTLPAKPEDYKLKLSPAFKAPAGVEFVPNENDPLLPQARAFAQKHALSQDAFSELLDLHAAGQVGSQAAIAASKAEQLAKLGAAGTARMDAVTTWLRGQLGDDLAKEMTTYLFTAKQVEAVEKLISNVRTQGGGSYTPTGREPPPSGREIPNFDKMSFEQRRWAQDQMKNGART